MAVKRIRSRRIGPDTLKPMLTALAE